MWSIQNKKLNYCVTCKWWWMVVVRSILRLCISVKNTLYPLYKRLSEPQGLQNGWEKLRPIGVQNPYLPAQSGSFEEREGTFFVISPAWFLLCKIGYETWMNVCQNRCGQKSWKDRLDVKERSRAAQFRCLSKHCINYRRLRGTPSTV
jgi:hypothetical protein